MRATSTREDPTAGLAVSSGDLEHLIMMATRAPSVHNSQPWRFTATADGVLIGQDRSRQLGIIDPTGRELLLSCGAAIHHFSVAARAVGINADVELMASENASDTVALIRLRRGDPATAAEVAAGVAILHRHTYRGRFADCAVPDSVLDQIRLAVEGQSGMLRIIRDDELVDVEVLVSSAERALHRLPGYAEELARWVWPAEDEDRDDGLPPKAVDHGTDRAESLEGRQFREPFASRPDEPPVAEHPTVVMLSSLTDTAADWVRSGQALSALLLTATELGVVAQPFGQVIDLDSSRQNLARLLGTVGAPQMLLRLGLGTSVPSTPRRSVLSVAEI